MNLKIDNYKNLNGLDIDFEDNKINFIFGISGSGKSSIGEALALVDLDSNSTVNKSPADIKILVNDEEINEQYSVYDLKSVENLLLRNSDNNFVYEIIFDNDNEIKNLKKEFQDKVASLDNFRSNINEYIAKVDILNKNLGGKKTKKNDLPSSSKIVKLINAISSSDNEEIVKSISKHGNWYLPWMKQGISSFEFENGKCPFCKKSLDEETISSIKEVMNFDEKGFEAMFQDSSIITNLNIKVPNFSDTEELFLLKEEIIDNLILKEEMIKILNFLDYYKNNSFDPSDINVLNLSDKLFSKFSGIKDVVDELNKSIGSIKATLGKLKNETDKVIARNLKKLNSYLDRFGIKYNFKIDGYLDDSNSMSYSLYHKLDISKSNRIAGLSYGEKNIISLILFLLSVKDKFIIIDDPASSFDDYRRNEILEVIYDLCYDKTVLVLSHDHIFMKYAIFNQVNSKKLIEKGNDVPSIMHKYKDNTGRILTIENYEIGKIKINDIAYGDFDILTNHILNYIENGMDYYRLIINLRLYYECCKNSSNDYIYQYLSAIYHRKSKEEINNYLKSKGLNENDIIDDILSETGIKINAVPTGEYYNIDTSCLSLFEKLLYYRDLVTDATIKSSYSNVVHMNESLQTCLNPYKFNYFSPFVYDDLNLRN